MTGHGESTGRHVHYPFEEALGSNAARCACGSVWMIKRLASAKPASAAVQHIVDEGWDRDARRTVATLVEEKGIVGRQSSTLRQV